MARQTVRIPIPVDPSDAIELLRAVKTKHTELAAASPLSGLEWDKIEPALAKAEEQDALSDRLYRDADKERNLNMPVVNEAVRAARDVLLGVYRSNPKKAGDFGFTVNDSVKSNGASEPEAAKK